MPVVKKKAAKKGASRRTAKKQAEARQRISEANAALYGGVDLPVVFVDGSEGVVKVCHLKVRERGQEFLGVVEDAVPAVAMCTGKDEAFIDALTENSLIDLWEKAIDLNFTPARRWVEQQIKLKRSLMDLASKITQGPASLSASQTSP